jgi:conjugal transfer pilin signal peptidase TrbI
MAGSARRLSSRSKVLAIAALGIVCSAYFALDKWSERHAFMINASESLPNWGFFVESGRFPARGDYVVFHPGHDPLTRKYFGEEPEAFAKIAYGVPGDVVSRDGSRVMVNGEEVARLKPFTRLGDPLEAGPTGRVPEGCVFAATAHKDGFDSRYSAIGFVCRDRLVGTGVPVL